VKKLLIAAAISLIMTAAHADPDSRWYGVAGLGVASGHSDQSDLSTSSSTGSYYQAVDTKGNVLMGGAGYQLDDQLAIEATYFDMRGFGIKRSATYNSAPVLAGSESINNDIKAEAFSLSAKYDFKLNNSSKFYGRMGLAQANVKNDQTYSGSLTVAGKQQSSAQSTSTEKTKIVPYFGLGYEYDLNNSLALRTEFIRINTIGDKDTTGESAFNMITLQTKLKL